jgi:hypothetical protein
MKARVVWADPYAISRWSFPAANSGVFSRKSGYSNPFPTCTRCARAAVFAVIAFFPAGNWLVFYKVAEGIIYIRGLWAARIP